MANFTPRRRTVALACSLLTGACRPGAHSDSADTTAGDTGEPAIDPPGEALPASKPRDQHPVVSAEDQATMARDELAFALDLLAAAATPDNQVLSPTSLRVAFAQAYEGARGQTATEIAGALHFSLAKPTLHAGFDRVDLALATRDLPRTDGSTGDDSVALALHNQMFASPTLILKPAFLDVLAANYGTRVNLLDFAADPDAARVQINDWVRAITHAQIVDLLPPPAITPGTLVVLVDALRLAAPWAAPFAAVDPAGSFTRTDGTVVAAPTLQGFVDNARLYQTDAVQAAELPLRGDQLALVIVLPAPGTFDAFTTALDADTLATIFAGLTPATLDLRLPRFAFSSRYRLKQALGKLGLIQAFTPGAADFSGLSDTPMNIDDVHHQVRVEVDEHGVAAAAATAIVLESTSGYVPDPESPFVADRPFYFAIRDRGTDTTLLLGRVLDPTR